MPEAMHINCSASLKSLPEITGKVLATAATCGLNKKQLGELELSVEEAIVNICSYAHEGSDGELEIIADTDPDGRLVVQIIDNGIAFDPLSVPEPDLTVDIADRPIGGLGVFLIKKMMDLVRYRREDGKNILELIIAPK